MASPQRFLLTASTLLAFSASVSAPTFAQISATHPMSSEFTQFHGADHQALASLRANPAQGALFAEGLDDDDQMHLQLNLLTVLEYGNVDNLFDQLDDLAFGVTSSDTETIGERLGDLPRWNEIDLDIDNPDLSGLVDEMARSAARLRAAASVIASEGYAKAELEADIEALFRPQLWGGHFKLAYSRQVLSAAVALADDINFDQDTALAQLQNLYNLQPGDPATEFDLSGDITLIVDPSTRRASVEFANDSLLLTKAAKVADWSLDYSRLAWQSELGRLYLGGTLKYRQVSLAGVGVRIGDLTDSEELFDAIDDARFQKDDNVGLDLAVLWAGETYTAGLIASDLFMGDFNFPIVGLQNVTNPEILARLETLSEYQTDPQVTLEGSKVFGNGFFALSGSIDGLQVQDPLGQEFQWASVSANFNFKNWWLPNVNTGLHHNLTGSELTYLHLGLHFLKYMELKLAGTFDNTKIDGDTLPRGLGFSLGFNVGF